MFTQQSQCLHVTECALCTVLYVSLYTVRKGPHTNNLFKVHPFAESH